VPLGSFAPLLLLSGHRLPERVDELCRIALQLVRRHLEVLRPQTDPCHAGGASRVTTFTSVPREIEVLRLLPTSMTQLQMAAHLYVSRKTIQNNASSLYRKLGAAGRGDGVARAIDLGLLSPSPAGGRD